MSICPWQIQHDRPAICVHSFSSMLLGMLPRTLLRRRGPPIPAASGRFEQLPACRKWRLIRIKLWQQFTSLLAPLTPNLPHWFQWLQTYLTGSKLTPLAPNLPYWLQTYPQLGLSLAQLSLSLFFFFSKLKRF